MRVNRAVMLASASVGVTERAVEKKGLYHFLCYELFLRPTLARDRLGVGNSTLARVSRVSALALLRCVVCRRPGPSLVLGRARSRVSSLERSELPTRRHAARARPRRQQPRCGARRGSSKRTVRRHSPPSWGGARASRSDRRPRPRLRAAAPATHPCQCPCSCHSHAHARARSRVRDITLPRLPRACAPARPRARPHTRLHVCVP